MISDATQTEAQKGSVVQQQTEIPAKPLSPTYSDSSVQTESPKLQDRGTQWDNPEWVEDKKSVSGSSSASLKTDSEMSISIGKQSLESQTPPKSPESKVCFPCVERGFATVTGADWLWSTTGEGEAPLDEPPEVAPQVLGHQDPRISPPGSFKIISRLATRFRGKYRMDLGCASVLFRSRLLLSHVSAFSVF